MTILDDLSLAVVGRLCAARLADGVSHAPVAGPNLTAALDLDCPGLDDDLQRAQAVRLVTHLVDGARSVSVGAGIELELHHPVGGGAA